MWFENLTSSVHGEHVINDSKTPSGRVHVGSLRGVLIHDAIYRSIQQKETAQAKYLFGIDDFDPMDGLPADANSLHTYMGMPLCNIPAPDDTAKNLADYYANEFIALFDELAVNATIYKTSELYRQGAFNESIQLILDNADVVRNIYKKVSGSQRPANWYPMQIICQNCGKIGSTEVTGYNNKNKLVRYRCRKDAVTWAQGCQYNGEISPFDGNGKLPWKLEWAAKWHIFGVTIEGAGKDHCTKGGARDVAMQIVQHIFQRPPPRGFPYEFFLVSGAKMSSSKGIGTSAREMADFLPAEVLRYLMIRTTPKRSVNFSTSLEYVVRLFNEYDQLLASPSTQQTEALIQMLRTTDSFPPVQPVSFQLITALLQLPHVNVLEKLLQRYTFTKKQQQDLSKRITSAHYWLNNFATTDDTVSVQQHTPESVKTLSEAQKGFLFLLGKTLPDSNMTDEQCQQYIFDHARITPIATRAAFAALYRLLLDKEQGPRGGALLAYLEHDFLVNRLTDVEVDALVFLQQTAITVDELHKWWSLKAEQIVAVEMRTVHCTTDTFCQITVALSNNYIHILRVANEVAIPPGSYTVVQQQKNATIKSFSEQWQMLLPAKNYLSER